MIMTREIVEHWGERFELELRGAGYSTPTMAAIFASAFLAALVELPIRQRIALIEAHLAQIATFAPVLFEPRRLPQ